MTRLDDINKLVDSYIDCWKGVSSTLFDGMSNSEKTLMEGGNFGCEHLQIFKSGYAIQEFDFDEICHLPALLTRQLKAQVNRDHYYLWSWCHFIAYFRGYSPFNDYGDWQTSLTALVDTLLGSWRFDSIRSPEDRSEVLKYVNDHLLRISLFKHAAVSPLSYSVLEGLLRRKNKSFMNLNGEVKNDVTVTLANGNNKQFCVGDIANRINTGLRIFEQQTTTSRGRACVGLSDLKSEILSLYPSATDAYDLIDSWRNNLLHGNEYWQIRVPIIMNLISLLIIDEFGPQTYGVASPRMNQRLQFSGAFDRIREMRPEWDSFPPDVD